MCGSIAGAGASEITFCKPPLEPAFVLGLGGCFIDLLEESLQLRNGGNGGSEKPLDGTGSSTSRGLDLRPDSTTCLPSDGLVFSC